MIGKYIYFLLITQLCKIWGLRFVVKTAVLPGIGLFHSISWDLLFQAISSKKTIEVCMNRKKEPVNYFGKHEAVSQDLLGPSHLECGRAVLLPRSDNQAGAVAVPGS